VQIAFYKGPGDAVTHIIRLWTRSRYSHTEILFDNGVTFAASGRKPKGVSLTKDKIYDRRFWDFIRFNITTDDEERVFNYAKTFDGCPFSWQGVWRHIIPWIPPDNYGWYCTEIILHVLHATLHNFEGVDWNITPGQLYELLRVEANRVAD
jgi:hypothetical protein